MYASHSWKARIADRTTGCVHCNECEKEYQSVFPELLITLYAKRNSFHVVLHSDKYVGLSIEIVIPELRLGIDCSLPTNSDLRAERDIKNFICSKNNICYVELPYRGDEEKHACKLKNVLRKMNIIITTDTKSDIAVVREKYEKWRNSIEFQEKMC